MRRSEFHRAVHDEFGARADSVVTDLILADIGGRTAADALAAGVDPRLVWLALCAELDVPVERRYGVGRLEPRRL
ncbi:DUF3046 domain-containing protein [Microbacterium sp. NEAU-LLC]|uniref:DUF3046 domain-containing protein n=1 Tax=Microbacterium helvum TaxID=2773713 RepID=A0ABR8NSV2_9MICO|nr:DUF3046 domain-containing protein [Microbacterium helvum]MBD3943690.1 DUF3046 domain-containing protein [Microbacterium helvum]